jgi:hypothetical protein
VTQGCDSQAARENRGASARKVFCGIQRTHRIKPNIATLAALAFSAPLAAQTASSVDSSSNEGVFTLDNAIPLMPGVSSTLDTNGRRNEHDILVRGFGRWQVPLSTDGVRVYRPADNLLDFRHFLRRRHCPGTDQ